MTTIDPVLAAKKKAKAERQAILASKGKTTATSKKTSSKKADVTKLAKTPKAVKPAAPKKIAPPKEPEISEADLTVANKLLSKLAHDINSTLGRADTNQVKADNLRVTAAKQLEEAYIIATDAKISFKAWVEKDITAEGFGYEKAKKLLQIAKADDPLLALTDQRERNKEASKKARDKKKSATPLRGTDEPAPARIASSTPLQKIQEGMKGLEEGQRTEMVAELARGQKMALIDPDKMRRFEEVNAMPMDARVRKLFVQLRVSEKMAFVKWAAEELGGKFDDGFEGDAKRAIMAEAENPTAMQRTRTSKAA